MRSPLRWARRRLELSRIAPRRRAIEAELSTAWNHQVTLRPAATKGGYDEIYYANQDGKRTAVVRVNSPYKRQNDPIGRYDPSVPLDALERLDREWDAYSKLCPKNLSPRPIWRTHDAIACTWLNWERASHRLTQNRQQFWNVLDRIIPAIGAMHDAKVTHLDLNLGNLLLDPIGEGIAIIDFEFGPVDWVDLDQQVAVDYLRIIDDCTKPRRGGRIMLHEPGRLVKMLDAHVPAGARNADMKFSHHKLQRLRQQPGFCDALRTVFSGL